MSDQAVFQRLLQPLSEDAPCGVSLEDTAQLAAFDAYKIFGQQTEIGTRPVNKPDDPATPPPWNDVVDKSLAALEVTKDLRVLAFLGAGLLWRDGIVPFCETLKVAAGWFDNWFDAVYPQVEVDDFFFRSNALNYFADRLAIIDPLRRAAIVASRPLGAVSLRALEIATGVVPVTKGDAAPPKEAELRAVFQATPIAELQTLVEATAGALDALTRIDAKMTEGGGVEATPNFDGRGDNERTISLRHQLKRIHDIVRDEIKVHPEAPPEAAVDGAPGEAGAPAGAVGVIRSRQDAIRALDAVTMYFQTSEPSSPVPIFIDRAKRLISKSFLEALQEIVPDAINAAKAAGGIRDEN